MAQDVAAGPFRIVRSFPVSEATWAAKVGDLYLVAAERSVLVYRKTGPEPSDYTEVNRIFPGSDGRIENCAIAGDLLYIPATAQGLLAYRLADLATPGVQPAARAAAPRRFGMVSAAGGRVYATYADGGLGVFDGASLELLGEGLPDVRLFGLTATESGVVYTSAVSDYAELLALDAREPAKLSIASRVRNPGYATLIRFPAAVAGDTLYLAESNGGVGVYDITEPLAPVLRYRHAATGAAQRGSRGGAGQVRAVAVAGDIAFTASDLVVKAWRIADTGWQDLGVVSRSEPSGNGLLAPQGVFVREGVAAVLTTMEGVRFIGVDAPAQPHPLLTIDLPSRMEGLAKVGRMVYVTADVDGLWQLDWEAERGPCAKRRVPLKGLSEDLALRGELLYVANGTGLAVVDVSDETNPREVHYWDFPYTAGPNIQEGWVEGVEVSGATLFAAVGPAGLATFDLSEPARPQLLSIVKAGSSPWGHDISVSPSGRVLAFSGASRIVLLDVSDPAQPSLLADMPTPGGKGTQGSAFSPDGRYLVVCEAGTFSLFDVSDPRAPTLARSYEGCGSEGALFFGDYLLVSGRGAGVGVWRWRGDPLTLEKVQTLPCFFYNSKFWVEGDRIFTNSEGVDEVVLLTTTASTSVRPEARAPAEQ
jgi:hypothetical protein